MPELLVTDNGTQFKSAEFSEFCCENGIRHMTTVPFHPQPNGQAERFVDTFKRAVKKIQEGEGSVKLALDIFLLTYRSTPDPNVPGRKSPAEAMYNRPLRTSLDLLRPPSIPEQQLNRQGSSKARSLNPKDSVYAKISANNKWSWLPRTVVERIGTVMYNIWMDNGKLVRSHLNQLRQRDAPRTTAKAQAKQRIPLSILLNEWKLSMPALATPLITRLSETEVLEQSRSTIVPASPATPASGLSTSASSPSTAFESAADSSPAVQLPRRSSRTRRPPQRFQPYLRY
ncbi:uncharacterized protein K02A2.6-like [Sabethes cyaneus]|uniref:uncharacterized protein K02A2.6-like n=1 Tax=Sabethes cyaneus TaxID=53552 RepID=UPI00237DB350|nr:uncharacterized protein K02A2.6-like [Sabethes cyaneus]